MSTSSPNVAATAAVQPMAIVDGRTVVSDPGLDMLGCTYDVLKYPYSDVRYRGARVVNGITGSAGDDASRKLLEVDPVRGICYSFPSTITTAAQNELEVTSAHGASLTTYSNDLAFRAKVEGNYGAFSGEVKTSLQLHDSGSEAYTYLTLFDSRITADASFDRRDLGAGGGLSLDPTFVAALDDPGYDAAKFLDRWGTHVVSGIRIGGQIRYTCYTTDRSSTSESSLDASGTVRYQGLSGSTTVKVSTAISMAQATGYISGESQLLIYGGSAASQAQVGSGEGYDAWIDSVAANPAFAEFLEMIPVWELCSDPSRAAVLEATYKYRERLSLTPAAVQIASGGTEFSKDDYKGLDTSATGAAAAAAIQAYSASVSNDQCWVSENDEEVIVGFGGRIKGDHTLTRILVAVLNVRTGAIRRIAVGDGTTDPAEYEGWYQVPEGCVMTGIRLRNDDDDLRNARVFYQRIRASDAANGFLDRDREEAVVGSPKSSYEIEYVPPAAGNRRVLTGILLRARKNHPAVNALVLQVAELAPPR
jgi:hypothetical protein